MSQSGDKGTLEYRLERGTQSATLDLQTPDGLPVHQLKLAKLKPFAARAGISPIGNLDEIMFAYMEYLIPLQQQQKGGVETVEDDDDVENGEAKASSTSGSTMNKSTVAAELSTRVLKLNEEDDFLGILNLGNNKAGAVALTASSSVSILRKAYLKLSLVLHPDKNKGNKNATLVFQALVNAYERISQPELVEEATSQARNGKKKAATIARSNAGCYRTRVRCPRCKNKWSETTVEGNPEYFYNFMMTGIKSFNCATCLLEFGCMTAIHDCPHCQQDFEYHPSDFHRKITCGRGSCSNKPFGFKMFHCSDRVMKNLKEEVRTDREKRATVTEQKRRRAESYRRRNQGKDDANMETAFLLGLANECPRCGMSLADMEDADEIEHLRNCQDTVAIASHKRKKEATVDAKNDKKQRQEVQEDVSAKAAWDLLGASTDQMWMLTNGALEKECATQGVDTKGKKGKKMAAHEMIAGIVSKKKSQALTKYDASAQKGVTTESLPANLDRMTEAQLRAVAASHGIKVKRKMRKMDIIALLQSEQEKNSSSSSKKKPLLLTSEGDAAAGSGKKKRNGKASTEWESDSESESGGSVYNDGSGSDEESDYEPDE